jgi:hypothetical protein
VDTVFEEPTSVEVLPPIDPAIVQRRALVGLIFVGIAATVGGLVDAASLDSPAIAAVRLLLTGIGLVVIGSALTLRVDVPRHWLIAALAAGLASFLAVPANWDSFRLLTGVIAAASLAGAILTYLPLTISLGIISLGALFHFGGIFVATTLPEPTPWWSNQASSKVYQPYLSFIYMRNAYHFYSPDPGPASHVFVLLTYERDRIDPQTGKNEVLNEWITLPRRDKHMKDPLGLTYYRRLSLTEMVSGTIPDLYSASSFEKGDVRERRVKVAALLSEEERIPLADPTMMPEYLQYRVPRQDITRYLLPSYAKHLAIENSQPARGSEPALKVTKMRIYRAEHAIIQPAEFVKARDVYHPTTFRVYYLGEYDPDGKLSDSTDPMLYWLVPVVPKINGPSPTDPEKRDYEDFLSRHAKFQFDWRKLRP